MWVEDYDMMGVSMITAIVHHYALPDRLQEAETRILGNGRKMRGFDGFVSRQTLRSQSDPLKITTVTLWQSNEDRERWDQSPERRQARESSVNPWTKPPEPEFFDVIPEL